MINKIKNSKLLTVLIVCFLFLNISLPTTKIFAHQSTNSNFSIENKIANERGILIVYFMDINGNRIDHFTKKFTGFVGQKYDLSLMEKPQKKGYVPVLIKGKEKGSYTKEEQTVIYRFDPISPNDLLSKDIEYVYKHDQSVKISDKLSGAVKGYENESYTIPAKFKKPMEGYNIELSKKGAPETGYFSKEDKKSVIYTYECKQHFHPENTSSKVGRVRLIKEDKENIVNVVDEPTVIEGYHNDPYDIENYKQINGKNSGIYEPISIKEGQTKGKFIERESKDIFYLYKVKQDKLPQFNCEIVVKYVDDFDREVPKYTKKFKGMLNQLYDLKKLSKPKIEGYEVTLSSGLEVGAYKSQKQEIVYKIENVNPSKSIIKEIKYVYKHDQTQTVFASQNIKGFEGQTYDATNQSLKKDNYNVNVAKNSADLKGTFSKDNNKPIIFEYTYIPIYEPNNSASTTGQVTIYREDIDNPINFIEEPVKITGNNLDPYDTDNYTNLTTEEGKENYELIGIKPEYKSRGKFQSRKDKKVVYQYRCKCSYKKDKIN